MKTSRNKTVESEISTTISKGTFMEGKIESTQNIRIEGSFKGDIIGKGIIITSPNSVVQGNLSGEEIIIGGDLIGEINGNTSITIQSTGKVKGNIQSKTIALDKGGQFDGNCLMLPLKGKVLEISPEIDQKTGLTGS